MDTLPKIVGYIVMIVTVFLVFTLTLGPEGLLAKTRGGLEKIDFDPTDDSTLGEKISIPEIHINEIKALNFTINKMLKSSEKNCFGNYLGFSELGEGGTSIVMNYNTQKDSTQFMILGGAGGEQVATDLLFEIDGMVPCVIAGNKNVVSNFDSSFLNTFPWAEKIVVPNHYLPVQSIKISYSAEGRNGNHIGVPQFGPSIVNDESKNFMDAGIIYTPDNKHICFFPTVWGNNVCNGGDAEGLDDDCLGENPDENIAIPRQLNEGRLLPCSGDLADVPISSSDGIYDYSTPSEGDPIMVG